MKRILSVALVFLLVLTPFNAPFMRAAGDNDEARQWFYIDAIGGVNLSGQAALDKLGDMSDVLLALESGESGSAPDGPTLFYSPAGMGLDMSVYDVLGFKDRAPANMDGGVAVMSSAYEAAEYFMHCIMNGTGWREVQGSWSDVYYITFNLDGNVPNSRVGSIVNEIIYFVYAYFPHYFYSGSTSSGSGPYTNSITILISHTYGGDNMNWVAEYNAAAALLEADASEVLGGTGTKINAGTDGEKLKKTHDYLAATVMYNLGATHQGQRAYCALIEEDAVCNGYALATSMLALRMGIDVPYMTGSAGGPHAWNLNLTGYPDILLVDTTWGRIQNPADRPGAFLGVRHDFFNRPIEDFGENKTGNFKRTWSRYYMSYIDYVHGQTDSLAPGMIFSEMTATPVFIPSDGAPVIDLVNEVITLNGFSVTKYSLNGGGKWTNGALPTEQAKVSKLFDKELTLWLENSAGETVKFPTIKARPKANVEKLAPYYSENIWDLMTKPTNTAPAAAPGLIYEYVKGEANGKMPSNGFWEALPSTGFNILAKPPKGDSTKNVYYFRSAVRVSDTGSNTEYFPAGKPFKISPAYFGAAPKYKIDYKKEIVKLKKFDAYSVGTSTSFIEVTEQKGIELNVSDYISGGTGIRVTKVASGKKPRADIQAIAPVARAVIPTGTFSLTCANGKITDTANLKKFEILGKDSRGNDKWGGVPKITAAGTHIFDVRLKPTAKLKSGVWEGGAASETGTLTIVYGKYTDSGGKEKDGILSAEITR